MIRKADEVIDSLETWRRIASPKSAIQWQEHRSAKECARAWLGTEIEIPSELRKVLHSHDHFGEILEWEAEPECLVPFDEFTGPANIDVLIRARDAWGGFVVAVEAKSDESFGPLVSRALSDALQRRLQSRSSKGVDRILQIVERILPPAGKRMPRLHQIRYQLLTATAAALSAATRVAATRTVVLIHEFRTARVDHKNLARNRADLVRFLRRLGVEDPERVFDGVLVGPIQGVWGAEGGPRLYVGKAVREVGGREV